MELEANTPGYLKISVSDSGTGMEEKTIHKAFEPFFTTKASGRGLGLAAVQGIIRGHGGALRISSDPGRGTAFRVLLPASAGAVSPQAEPAGAAAAAAATGVTVLLADDDPAVREIATLMLEQAGYTVWVAEDGRQAVEMFRAHRGEVRLVVLDMTMPVMSGEEAFLEIRELAPDIPVILSSGYNEQDSTARFVGRGLAGFIQKPYRYQALVEKIAAVLDAPG
jgi:CheY-like chemotaxis protein